MNTDDFIQYIELDLNNFWSATCNPINKDALPIRKGVTSAKEASDFVKQQSKDNAFKAFFYYNHIIKGEYVIAYMDAMILTSKRLFLYYDFAIKTIPLKHIIKYYYTDKLCINYQEKDIVKSIFIGTEFIGINLVNSALRSHHSETMTEQEIILASNLKTDFPVTNNGSLLTNQDVDSVEYARKGNRNGAILMLVIVTLFGGCIYYVSNKDTSQIYTGKSSTTDYDKVTGKKQKKCGWCGGYGRQGISGESVAWCEKHGGVDVPCLKCDASGYVDE